MNFRKAHPASGSRPGTLVIAPDAPEPQLYLIQYTRESMEEHEIARVEDIPADFPADSVTWIAVRGLGNEAVLRAVGNRFKMSPLALEDAVNVPQRAKSELYPDHHLVISRVPLIDANGQMSVPQVCFVIGRDVLVTFQEKPFAIFDVVRERIRSGVGRIREAGADYLAYALIDSMVDRYYPITEGLANQLEDMEEELFEGGEDDVLARLRQIRGRLVLLRRIGWPQREMVHELLREDSPYVSADVQTYLRDTLDHIAQIVELVDSSRDHASALSDEFLSSVGQRTNEIMKVLTLMASVFIPLTFIAGIYGMNFDYMPELRNRDGYFVVLAVMLSIALGMLFYFWRRGWMGGRRRSRRRS